MNLDAPLLSEPKSDSAADPERQANSRLKIIDGVLRFRIFKVDPEAPANPPPEFERLLPSGGERGDRERRPRRSDRDE